MRRWTAKALSLTMGLSILMGGCNSSGTRSTAPGAAPNSLIDDAAARCLASTLIGAGLGGVLGAAMGGGQRVAVGAAVGAGIGGIACVILTALDAQDKARIREAQIAAAVTNKPQYLAYQGTDGRRREIRVKPQIAPASAVTENRICRVTDTQAAIIGAGSADLPQQLVCRTPKGDWVQA